MPANNTGQTEIVNDIPAGAQPVGGDGRAIVTGFRPVCWNLQTVWESPFFWLVMGAGLAIVGMWAVKKKL